MKKILTFNILAILFFAGFSANCAAAQTQSNTAAGTNTATKKETAQPSATPAAPKKVAWKGVWSYASRHEPATLTITSVSKASFKFEVEAANGANSGSISGTAKITGKTARFDDRDSTEKDALKEGCVLDFVNSGDKIELKQSEECRSYAGNAVYFEGEYQKGEPKIPDANLVELEVLPDAESDAKFRQMVGGDYERFLNAFHLRFSDGRDEALDAEIVSGCVRGICPYNAAMVMPDKKGNLWAALIVADDDGKTYAYYYSNAADWTAKMPKPVEDWVAEKSEHNKDLQIVYKNKQ